MDSDTMFKLHYKLDDSVTVEGQAFTLDLSYGKVLRFMDLTNDETLSEPMKQVLAIRMALDIKSEDEFPKFEEPQSYEHLIKAYVDKINNVTKKQTIEYDLNGDPMPIAKDEDEEEPQQMYDLTHDAQYIYSSFIQAYGIDLIDEQNNLHWYKFNALLNGLPDNTKFAQVLSIRSWKKSKGDSSQYVADMKKLQKEYKLPN